MSRFISGQDDSAVEDLLSQAKDHYVLEQVAKINCSGFTNDSALPTNLETRFRSLKSLPVSSSSRKMLSHSKSFTNDSALPTNLETRFRSLKSLPVTRSDPVSSSSRKLLSHSKTMARYPEKKNRGNVSSVSSFSKLAGKSCPLDSAVEETRILSGIKRNLSVNSRGGLTDSVRIGSSSSRFLRESKILTQPTQTLPKEKSRISSSSLTSIDLASPSSHQDQKEGSNRKSKPKPKFLTSWFDKLSPAQAMGCLRRSPDKSSPNSKKPTESSNKEVCREEELEALIRETERAKREAFKAMKRIRRLTSDSKFDQLLGMIF